LDLTLKAQSLATCPLWVIRCGAIQPPSRPLSVVSPTATLVLQCSEWREVP